MGLILIISAHEKGDGQIFNPTSYISSSKTHACICKVQGSSWLPTGQAGPDPGLALSMQRRASRHKIHVPSSLEQSKRTMSWSSRFNSHVIWLRIGHTRLVFLLNIPFSKGDRDTDPAVAVQPTLQWHLVFKPHASFNSAKVDINAYLWTPSTHQETKDRSQNTKNAPACMPSTWTLQ